MSKELFTVYLIQHGETEWSLSGRCAGTTDLPLTDFGEHSARRIGEHLSKLTVARVFTSPLQRTCKTCELAGFASMAELDLDLVEWNYGRYEGRWPAEICADRPEWSLFHHGCPSGEKPRQVNARADRVIARVQTIPGDVMLFTCGQFIRVLAARWLGVELILNSPYLTLNTASLSALGYELDRGRPLIRLWNDTSHLNRETEVTSHAASHKSRHGSSDRNTTRPNRETDRFKFEEHHLDQGEEDRVEWCETFKAVWVWPHSIGGRGRTV